MKSWMSVLMVLMVLVHKAQAELIESHRQNRVISGRHVMPSSKMQTARVWVDRPSEAQQAEILKAIALTNDLRVKGGLSPLRHDESLSAYAQLRAGELEQKFSHERPNGELYHAGMTVGRSAGENIAGGVAQAQEAVSLFQNSPSHYQTLMRADYTKIGMGMVYLPDSYYKHYWVQTFGADNTSSPVAFKK